MNGGRNHTSWGRHRSLQVNERQALALLAALELAPFEDEVLTRKLLDLVYRDQPEHTVPRHLRATWDLNHRRPERR